MSIILSIILIVNGGIKNFLKEELYRNFEYLQKNSELKPYFLLYRVNEVELYYLEYTKSGLAQERETKLRIPYVEMRVGTYREDGSNSKIFGSGFLTRSDFKNFIYPSLPVENEEYPIRHTLWKMTDFAYKNAVKNYYEKEKSKTAFLPEDTSASFSREKPIKYRNIHEKEINYKKIKKTFDKFYLKILNKKFLYTGKISFYSIKRKRYIINTEGTEVSDAKNYFLLKIFISAFDKEGKYYKNSREFFAYKLDEILNKKIYDELEKFIQEFKSNVEGVEIREYRGDVVLKDIASTKFISEIVKNTLLLSKDNYESLKYFVKKLGDKITTDIDVYDKPWIKYFNKVPLAGFLLYDDEGVKSQEVKLVEKGVLKNFLLKREPVDRFKNSNGHARAGLYSKPNPFITNLFVDGKTAANFLKDSILVIQDIEFKSPLSFEVKSGFILYKNGEKKKIKNIEVNFSSSEQMWNKIKGLSGNLKSFNFFEGNPYLPFSVTTRDIILKNIIAKGVLKKRIRND